MFTRPCARPECRRMFDYCGSCQPGRRYCGDNCSEAARHESTGQARNKFNRDRRTPEAREAHRLEMAAWREKQKARQASGAVRDQRCDPRPGELQVPSAASQAALEIRDVTVARAAERPALVQWLLVAWPEALPAARRRLGKQARCPFCGRRGRIGRVISIDQWRRQTRRSFGS